MRPPAPITTDRRARTRIHVDRAQADEARGPLRVRTGVEVSDSTVSALRPILMHRGPTAARVSLVPEGALLLAGDAIEVQVVLGPGAALEIVEPGGTVAFDMRGDSARWQVDIRLAEDARLTWAGEPFVVAGGADVERRTAVELAPGAALALRETLVLGRYGEPAGRLHQHTVVQSEDRPVLIEDLPLDPHTAPLLLGGHRVLSTVLLAGEATTGRAAPAGPVGPVGQDRFDLERAGVLWRRLAVEAHLADLGAAWAAARQAVVP